MKKSILILSVAIVLVACKGETTWMKQVDNRSGYTVTVTYDNGMDNNTVTKVVEPHTTEVIFYGEKEGADETQRPCLEHLNNLTVTLDSGLVLLKNIDSESNWETDMTSKNLGGVVTQTCRIILEQEDFEE